MGSVIEGKNLQSISGSSWCAGKKHEISKVISLVKNGGKSSVKSSPLNEQWLIWWAKLMNNILQPHAPAKLMNKILKPDISAKFIYNIPQPDTSAQLMNNILMPDITAKLVYKILQQNSYITYFSQIFHQNSYIHI